MSRTGFSQIYRPGSSDLVVSDGSTDVDPTSKITFTNDNLAVTVTDLGGGEAGIDVEGPTFSDGTHNESSYFVRLIEGFIVSLFSGFAVGIAPDWGTGMQDVADTAANGAATAIPRSDHVHKLGILTTKGDLLAYSTKPVRKAVGTDGYVLTADSSNAAGVDWKVAGSPALHGALLESTGSDQTGVAQSTDTAVTFDTTTFDTDSFVSGDTLVVPTGLGGTYMLTAGLKFSDALSGSQIGNYLMKVKLNGSDFLADQIGKLHNTAADAIYTSVSRPVVLADADVLSLYGNWAGGGGGVTCDFLASSGAIYLGIHKIG